MTNYEVTLGGFSATEGNNPLEAARNIASICEEEAFNLIYEVEDETTGERFSIDLSDESIYPMSKKIPEGKIHKAFELLQAIVDIKNLPAEEYTDGECLDKIFDLEIETFLKDTNADYKS